MNLIPEETIQEAPNATDVVALVDGRFPLKRRGEGFWVTCPFHNESSPSFKVSPSRQIYRCFSYGAGESIGFPSAVMRRAEKVGITIREHKPILLPTMPRQEP
jgi:DNA primase